ncbi:META domain-containing protein [Bosea sp. (in: a-proteobacteria)]|uniref:META domain-containing protein n=1 Tax=Bosea sp. (in: a-proteobacteria) TaxID=1871050 RepID=UPI003F6E8016
MNRRLGYAAVLALSLAPMLLVSPASAQRRGPAPQQPTEPQQRQTAKPEQNFPLGASWSAISLNGKPIRDRKATLQVDANLRGTGFSGCNTFSASAYPLREQGFAVGPVALTKRSCDKAAQDFERAYLIALRAARNWELVAGRLVIKGGGGELQFDRGI